MQVVLIHVYHVKIVKPKLQTNEAETMKTEHQQSSNLKA